METAQRDSAQLQDEQVAALWQRYANCRDDIEARNKLVEYYMPIVRQKADQIRHKLPEEVERDDLISTGTIGLMEAVASFDPTRGVKFETFCAQRIRGAMVDGLRSMDWVPRKVRSRATKLNDAYKVFEGRFGRRPSEEELARFLDLPVDEVHRTITETGSVNVSSLDRRWTDPSGENDVTEMEILADDRAQGPTEQLERRELIRACTKGLNKTERFIIILYYFEEMTMKEIGATLDLSESRVSQMHSAIISRIKKLNDHRRTEL
ncbi:MAG: FliA/WhiG family RNA polymerase sigma factor [Thermoguttaceae bacterium]|nr:FliA/WhiG family RNA polymerase sigma factor [Thermoguttaceae bacterium]